MNSSRLSDLPLSVYLYRWKRNMLYFVSLCPWRRRVCKDDFGCTVSACECDSAFVFPFVQMSDSPQFIVWLYKVVKTKNQLYKIYCCLECPLGVRVARNISHILREHGNKCSILFAWGGGGGSPTTAMGVLCFPQLCPPSLQSWAGGGVTTVLLTRCGLTGECWGCCVALALFWPLFDKGGPSLLVLPLSSGGSLHPVIPGTEGGDEQCSLQPHVAIRAELCAPQTPFTAPLGTVLLPHSWQNKVVPPPQVASLPFPGLRE